MKIVKNKQLWLGLAITVVSLYFAVRNISFGGIVKAFDNIRPLWILPSLFFLYICLWLRGLRWKILFKHDIPYTTNDMFKVVMIGYMFNNLFPARMGEFVRIYILGKDKKVSRTLVFSTIFTERLYDVISLMIFLALFLIYVRLIGSFNPAMESLSGKVEHIAIILVPLIALCIAILFFWPEKVKKLIRIVAARLPKVSKEKADNISHAFIDGLEAFRNPGMALKALCWSSLSWVLAIVSTLTLIEGFGFRGHLATDIAMATAVLIGVNFAMVLPATPGYVGIFEAAVVASLMMFGLPKENALAFAFLFHALNYFPIIILGWYYLMSEHLSFKEVATASRGSIAAEDG